MPIARPAETAGPMALKLPTSAAASAGTMNRVYETGMSGTIGAIRMPDSPAIIVDSAQLAYAMRSGDRPVTSAPVSVSAAARVARPNRVSRNAAISATVSATMIAANHSRSCGIRRSPNRRRPRAGSLHRYGIGADAGGQQRLDGQHQRHRCDGLGGGRRVAQQPEQREVQECAEGGGDRQGDQHGREQSEVAAEVDGLG